MTDQQQTWRLTWMSALGHHLAQVLTPELPEDRELVSAGLELAVMVRRVGAPLRVATTYRLPEPSSTSILDAGVVDQIVRDVQDEIAIHLGRAWPVSAEGEALQAVARPSGEVIALSFEPRSADPARSLILAPFVPPPGLDGARVAG